MDGNCPFEIMKGIVLHGKTINPEKNLTPDEIDMVKEDIAVRHNRLGLDKNLKKELYPELFD